MGDDMSQMSFGDPERSRFTGDTRDEHVHRIEPAREPMTIEPPISARFAEFHRENPRVYDELVRLARRGRQAGRTKMGINQLFEVLRWNVSLTTRGEDFKLNNNYAPHYARLIMDRERDLAGIFELRRSHADETRDA
jgi:hypothetical protein